VVNRPRRNVELKARDPSPARSRRICLELGAEECETLWQRDTYFTVSTGRLKLREEQPGGAHVIQYDRDTRRQARESRYRIAPVRDAAAVLSVLQACLGMRVTVTKSRRLFIWEDVRIHLDDVEQLGNFIEFEAVAPEDSDLVREHRRVARLREAFGLADELLVPRGYADELLDVTDP
jgi:predicted adenylyl cyclase CyaB